MNVPYHGPAERVAGTVHRLPKGMETDHTHSTEETEAQAGERLAQIPQSAPAGAPLAWRPAPRNLVYLEVTHSPFPSQGSNAKPRENLWDLRQLPTF